jgi:hypothetical protein
MTLPLLSVRRVLFRLLPSLAAVRRGWLASKGRPADRSSVSAGQAKRPPRWFGVCL